MISYCIAHKDRTDLFEANLRSLINQTDRDFEIVITDNSTDRGPIKSLVQRYRDQGLSISCFFVDVHKSKSTQVARTPFVNPAIQQNIAVKKAKGDIIILTSPEVVNATDNVARIKSVFKDSSEEIFLYGWVNEREIAKVSPELGSGFTSELVKSKFGDKYGEAVCNKDYWRPCAYFLGAMKRDTFIGVQGIEEKFMMGQGYEDDDFIRRLELRGVKRMLNEEIVGIHLCHRRGHWNALPLNDRLFQHLKTQNSSKANLDIDWGDFDCITETF